MFKYERLNHDQIQTNLESGIKCILLNILPLDLCHCIATGCVVGWFVKEDDERHLVCKPMFKCIVVKSDKTDTVIVYEERPKFLGGPRAAAFDYAGPKPPDGSSGGPLLPLMPLPGPESEPKPGPKLPEAPPEPWGFNFDNPKEYDGT